MTDSYTALARKIAAMNPSFEEATYMVNKAITLFAEQLAETGMPPLAIVAGAEAALAGLMAAVPETIVREHVLRFVADVEKVRERLAEREEVRERARGARH